LDFVIEVVSIDLPKDDVAKAVKRPAATPTRRWRSRPMVQIAAVLLCLGLIRMIPLALRRRAERASHTLARDILDTSFTRIRKLVGSRKIEGDCGSYLARALEKPSDASAILQVSSRATTCRLPDGLTWDSRDPAAWKTFSHQLFKVAAEVAALPTGDRCLDLLGLARDAGLATGTDGVILAERVTSTVLQPCAQVFYGLQADLAKAATVEVEALRVSTPALAQAFREQNFSQQVSTFGAAMRPADVDTLPPALRTLAGRAKPLTLGFVQTFRAHGVWLSMTKHTLKAIAALELSPKERSSALISLERESNTPFAQSELGLSFGWSQAEEAHRRRLEALQLFKVSLELGRSLAAGNGPADEARFAPIRVYQTPATFELKGELYTISLTTPSGVP
jgi:hypothetical protein